MTRTEYLRRSATARDAENYALAAAELHRCIEEHGPDSDVYWVLAGVEWHLEWRQSPGEMQGTPRSLEHVRRAIDLNPNKPEYYVTLAILSAYAADVPRYQAAAEVYRIALQLEPMSLAACEGMIHLYSVPDEVVTLDEALECSFRLLRMEPTEAAWMRHAELLTSAGRHEESQQAMEQAYCARVRGYTVGRSNP